MTAYRRSIVDYIIEWRKLPLLGALFRQLALAMTVDVPRSVTSGSDLRVLHRGKGIVLHPKTQLGHRVRIFHNVTVGRGDLHSGQGEQFERINIEDDVWLSVGAVVLASGENLTIGKGTIVAANAVLTQSTGEWEIWGGVPARKIADRPRAVGSRISPTVGPLNTRTTSTSDETA